MYILKRLYHDVQRTKTGQSLLQDPLSWCAHRLISKQIFECYVPLELHYDICTPAVSEQDPLYHVLEIDEACSVCDGVEELYAIFHHRVQGSSTSDGDVHLGRT